ncbi:hypothetical protein OX284_003610 [Flavobacterium sp. SUN046]|uniref:hypothetical protein n=1 Tax=Flavobacterium sp. SUN046 TaxID=3002440 RepID=UPI002DBBCE57|nr:hypothetical protein [Flavobacterium sp. SUN046]MEC4048504.1 hypothetical protein [Flavobacterium sp. SUN046]
MTSKSETGHAKNISNFETVISFCTGYGPAYNPSNEKISIAQLTALHINSTNSNDLVKTAEANFNDIEGQRMIVFNPLKPIATRVFAALKGSQPPATVIADAKTIYFKIQGKRTNPIIKMLLPSQTVARRISVSQQSYDLQIDHFDKFIDLVTLEPKYDPNEDDLKVSALNTYKADMMSSNISVKNAYVSYSNAMITRNHILYDAENGLVARAALVKDYVKSIYGANSPEFKQIRKISFKRIVNL